MSRYRLPCATVRRDRRAHAVAQRHVYPLHLATPAMPTHEGPTPSTLAKKEGERADCELKGEDETVLIRCAQWKVAAGTHRGRGRGEG